MDYATNYYYCRNPFSKIISPIPREFIRNNGEIIIFLQITTLKRKIRSVQKPYLIYIQIF